jgi:hypothetical protein
MAVVSLREVLPRTFNHKFGEAPTAELKYIVTVDGATPTQEIINTVGIFHGSNHPEYGYLRCLNGSFNETDLYHVEATYSYELPKVGNQDLDPNPLARPDVWSFSTGGAQVPALYYFEGSGKGDVRPLVNSAFDFFEGLTTVEAEVRATIAWNRANFPASLAAAVTNAINQSPYLWGGPHTWQCAGISAQRQYEVVNEIEIGYWSGTTELVYRASGWDLYLPDVGFNCFREGAKEPCRVKGIEEEDEEVAATTPQALSSNGAQKYPPGSGGGPPDILTRRVYREINFEPYFGSPPP